jgi:uncharacterized protein YidB (DUF937 family)
MLHVLLSKISGKQAQTITLMMNSIIKKLDTRVGSKWNSLMSLVSEELPRYLDVITCEGCGIGGDND